MKVWSLPLGECLFGKKEPSNRVDKNAITVISLNSCGKEEVIGLYVITMSRTCFRVNLHSIVA